MNQDASSIAAILERSSAEPGGLLPALHAIQDTTGYIPEDRIAEIARAFNLSQAEVYGVISFYHDFRMTPPAKHAIRICCAEACQSMGSEKLLAHAKQSLGCGLHEKTADSMFSLESVYCLGHCACSPAIMLDGAMHARVTPERLDQLVANVKENP
ncbi:MAG TPA: formate dehydrogenase subunit gamma [Noviherbaspirillum sp.]|uniref:formate dehydrogenase subunit gamma n=1 Tax=Noviherbaspirillum sp. TaxID=1926288 RepID=UPI002B4A0ED4|nr:formate dehydrogenase subunit gamma [Noviherbaspirillum sp.]HJV85232.1 formate dehydrogenase subunit gamma [Noviherbaspirillum sp.]